MLTQFLAAAVLSLQSAQGPYVTPSGIPISPAFTVPPVGVLDPAHQKDIDGDIALGKQYAAEVLKEMKPSTNKAEQARVERIGNDLAKIEETYRLKPLWGDPRFSPFPFHFQVLQGDDINAFSLPGGYVYVYEGLIKDAQSDDELAGVLAHEISHVAFRHVRYLQDRSQKLSLLTLPLVLLGVLTSGGSGGAALFGGILLQQAVGSGWSQQAESAADYGGFQILIRSRYNPVGLLTFFERMAIREKNAPEISLGIFRTHPASPLRMAAINQDLNLAGIPIRRSEVEPKMAVHVKPDNTGGVGLYFADKEIVVLAGDDALTRADVAAEKINEFLDTVPGMYQVSSMSDGTILGSGKPLITLYDSDASSFKLTLPQYLDQVVANLKNAIYAYKFGVYQFDPGSRLVKG